MRIKVPTFQFSGIYSNVRAELDVVVKTFSDFWIFKFSDFDEFDGETALLHSFYLMLFLSYSLVFGVIFPQKAIAIISISGDSLEGRDTFPIKMQ